jgi:hypothetical protein
MPQTFPLTAVYWDLDGRGRGRHGKFRLTREMRSFIAVGDLTQASVVGKRVGRCKWSPTTPKTLEGSAGFTLSVVMFAWALRMCGLVEEFSVSL